MLLFIKVIFLIVIGITSTIHSNGIIIPTRPDFDTPLILDSHKVRIKIIENIAEVVIDEIFYNPFDREIEGIFIFPIPRHAYISDFIIFSEGSPLKAEILDKKAAEKIYKDYVIKMKDPALLQLTENELVKVNIFPIKARERKKIQIKYTQIIEEVYKGLYRLLYIIPKGDILKEKIKELIINIEVISNVDIKNIYSPSHKININYLDEKHVIGSYQEKEAFPTKDLEVFWQYSKEDISASLLSYKEYFMLILSPKIKIETPQIINKDVLFVLDTSGSMAEDNKIDKAKKALSFCINNLNPNDRFNIITFSTSIHEFSEELVKAERPNIERAIEYIKAIKASGGTDIDSALQTALSSYYNQKISTRQSIILFITDGIPTVGETNIANILDNVKRANEKKQVRIFVIGIGYDVNTYLLDKLSLQNKSESEYISPDEDIELKISNFYQKLASPILSDIKISLEGIRIEDIYPKELTDIFKGSQILIFGRFYGGKEKSKAVVKLSGYSQGDFKEYYFDVVFKEDTNYVFIPQLWAAKKVAYLLDKIRLEELKEEEEEELINQIKDLSKKYAILTPYTAYLILEDEKYVDSKLLEKARREYMAVMQKKLKTGKEAFLGAKAISGLKKQEYISERSPQEEEYIKIIHDKVFYLREGFWTDVEYSPIINTKEINIYSEAYFRLLEENPILGKYLKLGKVIVCLNDIAYKIID